MSARFPVATFVEADPVAGGALAAHIATAPAHGGDLAGAARPPLAHLHPIADVVDLEAALDAKAPLAHTHPIADVEGLQAALDGKAAVVHTHPIADVEGLGAALAAPVAIDDVTGLAAALAEPVAIADVTGLQAALDAPVAIADVTGLQAALDAPVPIADVTGLQAALDDAVVRGSANTTTAVGLARPTGDDNGFVVKVPDSDWGQEVGHAYGSAQAFMVLKEDTAGATEPDDLVLFRVNGMGAVGLSGGMHVATGLRARPASTFPYSIHVNPSYDCTGIYLDSAKVAPASPYQQWRERDATVTPNVVTVVAEVDAGGVFRSYRGVVATAKPGVPGLVAQAAPAQTANVQEWRNSAGAVASSINSGGNVLSIPYVSDWAGTGSYIFMDGTSVRMVSRATGQVPLVARGVAGQTASIQEWQDPTGVLLGKIAADGGGTLAGTRVSWDAFGNMSIPQVKAGGQGGAATTKMLTKAVPSQTADLFQVQDSAAAIMSKFTAGGALDVKSSAGVGISARATDGSDIQQWYSGAAGTTFRASLNQFGGLSIATVVAQPINAANVPLVAKGITSQTANLQEWQSSTASVLARLQSGGEFWATKLTGGGTFPSTANQGSVGAQAATTIAWMVRGAASQTADLQQWQDSAGGILGRVNPAGALGLKAAAAAPAALAGYGYLYVDAGGALRYRGPTTDTLLAAA